jgi:hypothetical protein
VAALIARLLRKNAAANVAAKKVGKVRMMTPGELIRTRFRIPAGTVGRTFGCRVDATSISIPVTKKVAQTQHLILWGIDEARTVKTKTPARESWRFR